MKKKGEILEMMDDAQIAYHMICKDITRASFLRNMGGIFAISDDEMSKLIARRSELETKIDVLSEVLG